MYKLQWVQAGLSFLQIHRSEFRDQCFALCSHWSEQNTKCLKCDCILNLTNKEAKETFTMVVHAWQDISKLNR